MCNMPILYSKYKSNISSQRHTHSEQNKKVRQKIFVFFFFTLHMCVVSFCYTRGTRVCRMCLCRSIVFAFLWVHTHVSYAKCAVLPNSDIDRVCLCRSTERAQLVTDRFLLLLLTGCCSHHATFGCLFPSVMLRNYNKSSILLFFPYCVFDIRKSVSVQCVFAGCARCEAH